ncbi:DNase I-like protein [Punctularia strigosozonata HHB-11173 SS5]|uniref:DNase I-like protein n=1 Tax=Punctularia strigosozonata (strain HHB-11173) TaxID=741275 RepID=UPI0004417E06|nr:DNase I-like protein [Punctularia strigosozonata HHB-11173 SS5]EIN09638.1 DNase I-like protein [Punctularia strigosozonata HHB-11173 SS5]
MKCIRWNTYKDFEGILMALDADVICFQELKSCRANTERNVAVPGLYDAFLSYPVSKGGYSGVGVFTNSENAMPLKAEEGLSGTLPGNTQLAPEDRISASKPSADDMTLYPDEEGNTPSDLIGLDSEGRALMVDFGLFVLINVYCPNETSDARLPFKMNYHLMLEERVRELVGEGREVMVVGDMNICATPLDHCDGHLPSNAATFWDHPARAWFHNWLDPNGLMIDVLRRFWPERKGMYTVWNQKIGGRETNYGTRVDYILVTPGLLPWVKAADIEASVKGSDHCPIWVDLHDILPGQDIKLRDSLKMNQFRVTPRLAAKYWPEFSGKQTLLSSFFGKGGKALPPSTSVTLSSVSPNSQPAPPPLPPATATPVPTPVSTPVEPPAAPVPKEIIAAPTLSTPPTSYPVASLPPTSTPPSPSQHVAKSNPPSSTKRKSIESVSATTKKAKKQQKAGQSKLSTFFTKPPTSSPPASSPRSAAESKAAWSQMFAPIPVPRCTVHNELAKEWTVNKPGPNKGKTFYLCSRPVGPGYDKGRGERLREEVNPEYRCNFFKWASEVKREASRQAAQ